MDKEKLINISNNAENATNKDLIAALDILSSEFDKTKNLIVELTRHMDNVQIMFENINKEYKKRFKV